MSNNSESVYIKIEGGKKLFGEIELSGAKNAALPMIVAACLGEEETILDNVPTSLQDVIILINLLRCLGAEITIDNNTVYCRRGNFPQGRVPDKLASKIRYSLLLLGLTAALRGEISLPKPGGCKIGDRKYDLHLMGLRSLGAKVEERLESIELSTNSLIGENIEFYLPTTSGTENVMIAAVTAFGTTNILNANTRPEVVQLGELLNAMGAKISFESRIVQIEGCESLKGGVRMSIMPGWDEAVTYAVAAGITDGEICIPNFSFEHIKEDVRFLREAGVEVFEWGNSVYVSGKNQKKSFDLFTAPYPGINSDMQPIFASLALVAKGTSTIADLRFTDRFQYVEELKKFNAKIKSFGNTAIIQGGKRLTAATVKAPDLRGGAACVLAGLIADGETKVYNIEQINRGYENIIDKLKSLGADINVCKTKL